MRIFAILVLLLINISAQSQKLYGTVFNDKGDLLPYSSITVKGTSTGASANNQGKYSFALPPGKYTLICQHIGYTSSEKTINFSGDMELVFILQEQKLVMKEVVVKSGAEDPAYEIIRQAIRKRNYYHTQVNAFSCDMYGKDVIGLRSLPDKVFGKKIKQEDKNEMGLDSAGGGILYLSESISKVHLKQPDKFRMDVISSRVSGSNSFGFTFPAFISLYTNNVKVFSDRFNPRGFVSPIADGAIRFYKFKFLGTFWEGGKAVNSIRVTPRRLYEPLFTGIINITDEDWRIHSFDLCLTKSAQLELLDTLSIAQMHVPVGDDVWRAKSQHMHFAVNFLKVDAVGDFLTVYSNYDINPELNKKVFGNVLIKYDTAVNKRTKEYWDSIRPVPLEMAEQKDYKVKDSLFLVQRDSAMSRSHKDSLNKQQGKLKPWKAIMPGINRTFYGRKRNVTWGIQPLLLNTHFNNAEGVVINANGYIRTFVNKWKTQLNIEPHIRYGFSNRHLNAWTSVEFRKRQFTVDEELKRYSWTFSGGKRVTEFNRESPLEPLINSISILFYGKNYIKTYENYFGNIRYQRRFESGFRMSVEGLFEDRIPLDNTTMYTFRKRDSINITPNYPNEKIPAQFTAHQAAIFSIDMSFRPGQKYIQLPRTKIPIGSKYPTFSLRYTKAIPNILGSDANFDKWQFSVKDDKNLKLAGLLKYKVAMGGFLNRKEVHIQDFQHFNGNRTAQASEYLNSFQLADYYGNSTTASFYSLGHLEYHFNGLLTNKIPLFRRLNWNLVTGSNAFYINDKSNYVEVFAGLENIFKLFRIDWVAGYANGRKGLTGFRIGAGGALGSGVRTSSSGGSNSVQISF